MNLLKNRFLLLVLSTGIVISTKANNKNPQPLGAITPYIAKKYTKLEVKLDFIDNLSNKYLHANATNSLTWQNLKQQGFSDNELDYLAHEYCCATPKSHIVIIWPQGIKHLQYIINEINKVGAVIYSRKLTLKEKTQRYLLQAIPEKENAVDLHRKWYFHNQASGDIVGMLCIFPDLPTTVACKKKIRKQLNLQPLITALHIADDQKQSIELAKIFFNANSINYLNRGFFHPQFEKFNFMYQKYKNILIQLNIDKDFCCVDGSSILAMHGIRDINVDFDFLSLHQKLNLPKGKFQYNDKQLGPFDLHNNAWLRAKVNPIETIFNPKYHFYYQGLKFTALERMRHFYKSRETNGTDFPKIDAILPV